MAVKNFIFRENYVGREVTGMTIAFFAIFDPTWTHILVPNAQIRKNFDFQSIKKTEAILLPVM